MHSNLENTTVATCKVDPDIPIDPSASWEEDAVAPVVLEPTVIPVVEVPPVPVLPPETGATTAPGAGAEHP